LITTGPFPIGAETEESNAVVMNRAGTDKPPKTPGWCDGEGAFALLRASLLRTRALRKRSFMFRWLPRRFFSSAVFHHRDEQAQSSARQMQRFDTPCAR